MSSILLRATFLLQSCLFGCCASGQISQLIPSAAEPFRNIWTFLQIIAVAVTVAAEAKLS